MRRLACILAMPSIGCAGQAPPPDHPAAEASPPYLRANVYAVSIMDEREGVAADGRSLYMPETAIVGQEFELQPAIGGRERTAIRDDVGTYFRPGERTVEVDVFITTGRQTFKIGELRETLTVDVAVRVEIADRDDPLDVVTSLGEASLSREGIHVDRGVLPDLYLQAIGESLRRAFEGVFEDRP